FIYRSGIRSITLWLLAILTVSDTGYFPLPFAIKNSRHLLSLRNGSRADTRVAQGSRKNAENHSDLHSQRYPTLPCDIFVPDYTLARSCGFAVIRGSAQSARSRLTHN